MTTEEKAKAYDEALKVLHKYDDANIMFSQSLKEEMFPQLKESEDERIRKALLNIFSDKNNNTYGITYANVLAWLEKQDVQKPAWNEEDDRLLDNCISLIEDIDCTKEEQNWLKCLKDRIQPKQEWSEEDYNRIETIACHLDNTDNEDMADMLRNIRDKYYHTILQNKWKPSDEQMKQLGWIAEQNKDNIIGKELMTLYQDLKKLRDDKL